MPEQGQGNEQQEHDGAANPQVDGVGQGPRQQAGGAQHQVDAFRRFHLVAGIQRLGLCIGGEGADSGCGHRRCAKGKARC
ncbi:hypothetical protein D3C72_1729860 [compost metagenome]